jgi:transposase
MARSRIALEIGTHSPWISRLLSELGHEVIVANARKVRLIGESRKKDDRLDAQTLARLARIDPELLCPVKRRKMSSIEILRQLLGSAQARSLQCERESADSTSYSNSARLGIFLHALTTSQS